MHTSCQLNTKCRRSKTPFQISTTLVLIFNPIAFAHALWKAIIPSYLPFHWHNVAVFVSFISCMHAFPACILSLCSNMLSQCSFPPKKPTTHKNHKAVTLWAINWTGRSIGLWVQINLFPICEQTNMYRCPVEYLSVHFSDLPLWSLQRFMLFNNTDYSAVTYSHTQAT